MDLGVPGPARYLEEKLREDPIKHWLVPLLASLHQRSATCTNFHPAHHRGVAASGKYVYHERVVCCVDSFHQLFCVDVSEVSVDLRLQNIYFLSQIAQ